MNYALWLLISFALIGSLLFFSLKYKWKNSTVFYVVSGFSVWSELLKIFSHIKDVVKDGEVVGGVLLPKSLPFHLCSILIFIFFYLAISKNEDNKQKAVEFVVPIALFGGLSALFMATSGTDFTDPSAYQSFIYHAAIVWFALFFLITKKVNFTLQVYLRNVVCLFALVIIAIWINSVLRQYDTNFFFVVSPPMKGLPFLNMNHGWHVYFAHFMFLGLFLETALSLPYIIIDQKKKKNKVTE